jgi:Holliday junction resolvase RusA-like endonuclease
VTDPTDPPLLHAVIHGEPVAKRRGSVRVGNFSRVTLAPRSARWESAASETLARAWGERAPLEVPVVLHLLAVAPRPKKYLRRQDPDGRMFRPTKPDLSNAVKSAEDALVKAGVLRDDVLVVEAHTQNLYASKVEGPRVEVWLFRAPAMPGAVTGEAA